MGLEDLYEKYKDKGFEIVGVGCNQFGGQEPEKMEKVRLVVDIRSRSDGWLRGADLGE